MPGQLQVTAETLTPNRLFGGPNCYSTPDFQRPYIWTEANVLQLWDDIKKLADHKESQHFAGTLLLQRVEPSGIIQADNIIDGQQRLTTIQLLLAALHAAYIEAGCIAAADTIHNVFLTNQYGISPDKSHQFYKINHANHQDAEQFRRQISPDSSDQPEPLISGKEALLPSTAAKLPIASPSITDAYQTLRNQIKAYADSPQKLDQLQEAILNRLTFVKVAAQADEPTVYDIFGRLNSAGQHLAPPDMIKAATFARINQLPEAQKLTAQSLWKYSDDPYWRDHQGSGAHARSHLGHLLHYWFNAQSGEYIDYDNDALVKNYRTKIDQEGVIPSLQSLASYAGYYRQIQQNQLLQHAKFNRDFKAAGYETAYTIALFCLAELDPSAHPAALEYLGSYLMRLTLAGAPSASLNRISAAVVGAAAKQLRTNRNQIPPDQAAEIIKAQLLAIKGNLHWPDDQEVHANLTQKPLRPNRNYPILKAIAEYMEGPNSDITLSEQTTLEHIMPKSWTAHWPPPQAPDTERQRRVTIELLGNLTLLNGVANTQISNSNWESKRSIFQGQSRLAINRALSEHPVWDDAAIRVRSGQLAEIACQIWPKPEQNHRLL